MRPHPLGVQPLGNKLLGQGPQCCRSAGLGALAVLSDELLLHVLQHLSPDTLARLCTASRSTYAYCALDELWRAATLEAFAGDVRFCGSWRETYRRCVTLAAYNAPREWRAHIHMCLQGVVKLAQQRLLHASPALASTATCCTRLIAAHTCHSMKTGFDATTCLEKASCRWWGSLSAMSGAFRTRSITFERRGQ
jgi:F-box domain